MSVLETRGISVRFGGVYANTDVNIEVGEWEIVGIIGPLLLLVNLIRFPGGIGQQIRPIQRWMSGHRFDPHDRGPKEVQISDVRA